MSPQDDDRPARTTQRRGDELTAHILDATYEYILGEGYADLTIDAIAARAGVSKATIYTRWSTKYALVTDAAIRRIEYIDVPDLGCFEDEVCYLMNERANLLGSVEATGLYGALLAAAAEAPECSVALAEHTAAMQRSVDELIDRGIDRGEIAASVDRDALKNLLPAALVFRALLVRTSPSADFAGAVADIICHGALGRGSQAD